MAKKFLRRNAVADRYSVHVRTLERMVKDGRLPRPIYRGKFPLWDEDELTDADRAAAVARPKRTADNTVEKTA